MVMLRDPAVISEAEKRFALQSQGKDQIPADFRTAVYKAVIHSSNLSTFELLLKMYRETSLQEV